MPETKHKNKETRIIWIVCAVLIAALAVAAVVRWVGSRDSLSGYKDSQLVIKQKGQTVKMLTLAEIRALGEVEITAVLDTSKSGPVTLQYTGVLLKKVLIAAGIDPVACQTVVATAADGYTSAVPADKFLDADNVFLVFLQDGKPLGSKDEGGSGPLMLVIRKDTFSKNWCKFLIEVNCE